MTTATSTFPTRWLKNRGLFTGLLLMLAAWVLYSPSLNYGFVYYDDVRILRDHPELYGNASLAADVKAIFVTYYPREEPLPLRDLTWAIDSRIFGFGNAFGYHLGNVLLNGAVVALLFAFLLDLTRRYFFALATTIVFLLLAVHVEAVAWIMGRKDILSALFMLLGLLAQARRLDAQKTVVKAGWYAVVLLFLIAGLLSKISVLTFPAVLLLHAIFLPYLRGEKNPGAGFPWRPALREGLLIVPALVISGVTFIWYQRILTQMGIFNNGYTTRGFAHLWNLLMVDPLVWWSYGWHFIFPMHLAVFYGWPGLQSPYPAWQIMVALATAVAFLATALWLLIRRKDLFFYFAAGLALMIPYLNLVFVGIWVADRYVYFAAFCAAAILVSLAEIIWPRQGGVRQTLAVVAALLLANNLYQSVSYQTQWRGAESLWQYHVGLSHPDPRSFDNLGAYYFAEFNTASDKKDLAAMSIAIKKMKVVVEGSLNEFWADHQESPPPKTAFLFFLQSLIEDVTGKPEAALKSLLISDQLRPEFDSTAYNLAQVYRELAATATDIPQQKMYYESARSRFAQYIKLAFHGRTPPTEVTREMADLEAKCAAFQVSPAAK